MNPSDFSIHYHEMVFRLQCHERKGSDFQHFFEDIMVRHDPTFTPVKPYAKVGVGKTMAGFPLRALFFSATPRKGQMPKR